MLLEAYSTPTWREFGEYLHPDAVLHQAREIPDAGTYRGKEEFLRGLRIWLEEWEDFRYRPVEILEGRDRIFMRINLEGKGKGSGVALEQEIFNVWEMREGRPWRCEVYWNEDDARQAAGL